MTYRLQLVRWDGVNKTASSTRPAAFVTDRIQAFRAGGAVGDEAPPSQAPTRSRSSKRGAAGEIRPNCQCVRIASQRTGIHGKPDEAVRFPSGPSGTDKDDSHCIGSLKIDDES